LTINEIETFRTFIKENKRERYLTLLSSDRGRVKVIASLSHTNDFDKKWIMKILPSQQSVEGILALLRSKGAPLRCLVTSEWQQLDRKELDLETALAEVVGSQMGSLLTCIPKKLAYFENEDIRFILEHDEN